VAAIRNTRGILGFNAWIWVYCIVLLLQLVRGSWGDSLIFAFDAALIAANEMRLLRFLMHERPRLKKRVIAIGMGILVLLLSFIPPHTTASAAVFLAILPVVLWMVWYQDRGAKPKATRSMFWAYVLWLCFSISVCLWEYAANVLTIVTKDLYAFPTISVLIAPWIDGSAWGRFFFSSLWLLLGLGFLRIWRKP
jgi:hypothetical protein